MRRPIIMSVAALIGVLAVGGALAASRHLPFDRTAPAPAAAAPPPVPVVGGVVSSQNVPIYLQGVGTVIAYNTVVVRSQIQGQIVSINFTEGQTVHTGDLLAQIDPRPYQAQLDQVTATRDRDQAQLANAQANLTRIYDLFPRLKERRRQMAGTLSGGEQQMCAIGRGLMSEPKLLMLDEPSLGLAPILVDEVFELIRNIGKQGVTILLVGQNVNYTLQVSHYGYVMEVGRITLHGPSETLANNQHVREAYLGGSVADAGGPR